MLMKEQRKSYRERYFEDYQAIRVPANNKKGYRTEYRYTGNWAQWEAESRPVNQVKISLAILEVLSAAVYVAAVLSGQALSASKLFNGFGTLSLVPWILELSGLVRFWISGEYVKEREGDEISRSIRAGCVLRFGFTLLSAFAGLIGVIRSTQITVKAILAFAGLLVSAALSILIKIEYDKLLLILYHNQNGKPGSRI